MREGMSLRGFESTFDSYGALVTSSECSQKAGRTEIQRPGSYIEQSGGKYLS